MHLLDLKELSATVNPSRRCGPLYNLLICGVAQHDVRDESIHAHAEAVAGRMHPFREGKSEIT